MLGHRTLGLEDYTAILKKRWWMIAIPAIILPIAAYAASYLVEPQYLSQVLVLVEQQKVPDKYVPPVIAEDLSGRLASMREQIMSRSRLEPIITRFNLFPQKSSMDDRLNDMRKAIDIKVIESAMARGVPGFYISFQASDARTAQAVCSEITSMFVNANLKSRESSAQGTTNFLKSQLDDAKRSLDEQDEKLAKFEQQYVGRLPGQEEPNLNMLTSLNTQLDATTQGLTRMQQDLSYGQTILAQQTREFQTPETQRIAPQAQQQELQALLAQEADLTARYTPDYPDVVTIKRKIADLRHEMAQAPPTPVAAPASSTPRNEPTSILQLRAQIRAEELAIAQKKHDQAAIQSQIRTYQDRISSSPVVQEQYKKLTRDHQVAQESYDALLKNTQQAKMATDLERTQQGEQFSIMDQASLPEAPTSPKRPVFAAGGLVFGLLLGLGVVALIEYRDTALRSERDVWAFTKLPTLGTISLLGDVTPGPAKLRRRLLGRRAGSSTDTPAMSAGT